MFTKTFIKIVKQLKKHNSQIKKLKKENELFRAKLKCCENDMIQAFINGHSNTWTMIQVCLYDMYKNCELLDYSSLITALADRLDEYDKNNIIREEKLKQFDDDALVRKKMLEEVDAISDNDSD